MAIVQAVEIDWSGAAVTADRVQTAMFGTNMLFDRDRTGANGTFDDAVRTLDIGHVRFPGGSIAEWYFDIENPDATRVWAPERNEWRDVMPLSDFLAWAHGANVGASLVIPTAALLSAGPLGERQPKDGARADVYTYVSDVLAGKYGAARIEAFEIGNEYWLGGAMTHEEYAVLASLVAEAAQHAIDDHRERAGLGPEWEEPALVVQIGQYGRYSTTPGWIQNHQIMDALTDAAADAIDAVTAHYYTRGGWDDIVGHGYYFDRLDDWAADPRYAGIDFHVTEWNVQMGDSEETGLKQASALWMMFSEMALRGVDAAQVWPLQQNTDNDLAGDEGQPAVTLAGEAFRLMSEVLPGTRLTHRELWDTGAAWVYEGAGATHVFLASRSDGTQSFALDRADLGLQGQVWWKTTLGTTGAPADWAADPVLDVRADVNRDAQRLTFELDAYEVVRATFYDATLPAGPGTGFPHILTGGDFSDTVTASDLGNRIDGRGGDDILKGGRGDDAVMGGNGADHVRARQGDDTLEGGAGADTLMAGDGADLAFGGAGDDLIEGWAGDDLLVGGAGDDMLKGAAGDDVLWGGQGADTLDGGDGGDVYVFTAEGGPAGLSGLPAGWNDGFWG